MNLPTDEELTNCLSNTENAFIERKTSSDSRDWLKTVVGFANSAPLGYPAILFIGVKDDGSPEEKHANLDSVQKTLGERLRHAYPAVYYLTRIVKVAGRELLAVIVPGSPNRPHFAGPAYIREGSITVEASKDQFESLIATRNSKASKILEWRGKVVTIGQLRKGEHRPGAFSLATVVDCNQFFVTLKISDPFFLSLDRLEISFDGSSRRLAIIECPA